jgi:hypothetical protein
MRYDTIQNSITAHLKSRIDAIFNNPAGPICRVIDAPETEDGNKGGFIRPRLSVAYEGSSFADNTTSDFVHQVETLKFSVLVMASKLYETAGAMGLVTAVRYVLQGFKAADCTELKVTSIEPVGREQSVFMYALTFETSRVAVMEELPNPDLVLITQIILDPPEIIL